MAPKYCRRFQSGFVPESLLDRETYIYLLDCVALDWAFKLAFSPGLVKAGKTPG